VPRPGDADDARLDAAQALYDLAVDYIERAHAMQAGLIAGFQRDAELWLRTLGEVAIENADDEYLQLAHGGRFRGRLRNSEDGTWVDIVSPEQVADHYDPVDLFDDVAAAVEEAFPDIDTGADVDDGEADEAEDNRLDDRGTGAGSAGGGTSAPSEPTAEPWLARQRRATGGIGDEAGDGRDETASMEILRHLHEAGVYSDAEFAAKKAELDHPGRS
jgi:hypothetical protein